MSDRPVAGQGSTELEAQQLRPGDRLRYGSLLLFCDRVAVSLDAVTVEGVRMATGDTAAGVRETLSLSPGERIRVRSAPTTAPNAPQSGGLLR